MKNTKKLIVILLLVATCITLFSVHVMASTFYIEETHTTGTGSESAFLDADYSATADNYGGRSMISQLSALEKAVYYELADYFKSVANGETTSAKYTIKADLSSLTWTQEYSLITNDMITEKIDFVKIVHYHLIADYPYEMFWYYKKMGFTWDFECEKTYSYSSRNWQITITSITLTFYVCDDYRVDPNDIS